MVKVRTLSFFMPIIISDSSVTEMYLHLLVNSLLVNSLKTLNFLHEKDLELQPLLFSMLGGYMSQNHHCNLTCLYKD